MRTRYNNSLLSCPRNRICGFSELVQRIFKCGDI